MNMEKMSWQEFIKKFENTPAPPSQLVEVEDDFAPILDMFRRRDMKQNWEKAAQYMHTDPTKQKIISFDAAKRWLNQNRYRK